MRVSSRPILAAVVVALAQAPVLVHAASIQSLGDLPDGFWSRAFALSADGSVVAGISYQFDGSRRAFRWSRADEMIDLGSVPGTSDNGATCVSLDGRVTGGFSGTEGFRWTAAGGLQTLGHLGSNLLNTPLGANRDGSILVGYDQTVPFIWRSTSGLAALPTLPGLPNGIAGAINPDGQFIAGNLGLNLVRWNGITPSLIAPFPSAVGVSASTLSAEGNVIGGRIFQPGGNSSDALLWIEGVGISFLPDLPGGDANAAVLIVTGDGLVRVGFGSDLRFSTRATVWSGSELQSIEQLLTSQGVDLSYGYSLDEAFGISPDGRFIIGSGTVADTFFQEAFIAEITPIAPPLQGPFGGIARNLPGRIHAEDYDVGGQLVSFFDTTPGNSGGVYRADAVDLFSASDNPSGIALRLSPREWTEHTLQATAAGNHVLRFRVSSTATGGSLRVTTESSDSADPTVIANIPVPNTGSAGTFTVVESNVTLATGQQVVRVGNAGATDINVNWFEVVPRGVAREVWLGVGGFKVSQIPVTRPPSLTDLLPTPETPVNWADNYGTRLRAYLTAPTTGTYRFWVASDNDSSLLLSTDANPANRREIARVNGATNVRQWNRYASQQSASIQLVAGQLYYLEVLQKESNGPDHLSVGWSKPGQSTTAPSEIIPVQVLSPFIP
jgi:probable HAF family extracellular repeat protein